MKKTAYRSATLFIALLAALIYYSCTTEIVAGSTTTPTDNPTNITTNPLHASEAIPGFDKISVQCTGCGKIVILDGSTETVRHSCGTDIDALKILQEKKTLLSKFESVSEEAARENGCLSCHEGIGLISPKMAFIREIGGRGKGCSVCHEGDPNANTREEAHKEMYSNPGNLWLVADGKGCGKCHSENGSLMHVTSKSSDPHGQADHVYRVQRSLMATTMGIIASTLSANGLLPIGVRKYANIDADAPLFPRTIMRNGDVQGMGQTSY